MDLGAIVGAGPRGGRLCDAGIPGALRSWVRSRGAGGQVGGGRRGPWTWAWAGVIVGAIRPARGQNRGCDGAAPGGVGVRFPDVTAVGDVGCDVGPGRARLTWSRGAVGSHPRSCGPGGARAGPGRAVARRPERSLAWWVGV